MSFSFRLSWTYASRAEPVPSFPSTILSMEVVSLRHDALSIIRSRSLASSSARHVSLHECAQFPREQTRLPACSPPSLHVCPGVLVRASLFPASARSLLGYLTLHENKTNLRVRVPLAHTPLSAPNLFHTESNVCTRSRVCWNQICASSRLRRRWR